MATELWKLPTPVSALVQDPQLKLLSRRACELLFQIDDKGTEKWISIGFDDVAALKCSYLEACTASMFKFAYGRLVDLGMTTWLVEIAQIGRRSTPLRHLMIYFDDGPCYEFACHEFAITYPGTP
jgi:hypothetical protein